jgi:hypothetical protein
MYLGIRQVIVLQMFYINKCVCIYNKFIYGTRQVIILQIFYYDTFYLVIYSYASIMYRLCVVPFRNIVACMLVHAETEGRNNKHII